MAGVYVYYFVCVCVHMRVYIMCVHVHIRRVCIPSDSMCGEGEKETVCVHTYVQYLCHCVYTILCVEGEGLKRCEIIGKL